MNIAPELQGVGFAAREIVGILLLVASLSKMSDRAGFFAALQGYGLLPDAVNRLASLFVPLTEFVLGIGLVVGAFTRILVLAAAALLTIFTAWLIVALARGRTIGRVSRPISLVLAGSDLDRFGPLVERRCGR